MPVSAMNRSDTHKRRARASVSKIQSELASATSRKRASLSTMALVVLRLWRSAAAFDPARASLSTWLFRIARNLQIDAPYR